MDKYRHTDDNQELDDVSRLIQELKDLSGDSQGSVDNQAPVPRRRNPGPVAETKPAAAVKRPAQKPGKKPASRKKVKNHGLLPAWQVALINILVGGVIILTFAFFHHVLPAITSARAREEALLRATEPPVIATEAPAKPTEAAPTEATAVPTEGAVEPVTEPDNRTEWQKKFAEYFSDEIIRTENSYKSPNVSITVETVSYGEGRNKQTYHVADIYIGSIENFTTYVSGDAGSYATKFIEDMSKESDALIAISGDFLTYQKSGFLLRNGTVYRQSTDNVSICALFPDGTIETYEAGEYTIECIKNRGALQVWSFGPPLLDDNGQVCSKYDIPRAIRHNNPRSAIGYYEPGHYCFVIVDGRQDGYAKGMTIPDLAQIFVDLGCAKAYNLDGGGSAVMAFNHKVYSKQSNGGRDLGDILLIRETPEYLTSLTADGKAAATATGEGVG